MGSSASRPASVVKHSSGHPLVVAHLGGDARKELSRRRDFFERPLEARPQGSRRLAAMGAARRLIRAVDILARDGRIPRPLRGLAAFGVLPIPGPFDEAVLLIIGLLLLTFYRDCLREAWSKAAVPNIAQPS